MTGDDPHSNARGAAESIIDELDIEDADLTVPVPVLTPSDPDDVERVARYLHNEYEDIARKVGWETQEGTSVRFHELPPENREVMVGLAAALLRDYDILRPREDE